MSYGLQVFGSDGKLRIDTSSRLSRAYGIIVGNKPTGLNFPQAIISIFYPFPTMLADGNWFVTGNFYSIGVNLTTDGFTAYWNIASPATCIFTIYKL